MVLVASIGTLQYRNQKRRDLASNVIETKPAIEAREQSPEPAPQMAAPQAAMQNDKLAAPHTQTALAENKPGLSEGTVVRPRPNSAVAAGGAIASFGNGSGAGRSLNGRSFHGSAFAGAPPTSPSAAAAKQNPAPAPAQQTVEVSGASQMVEVQTETAQITTQPVPQNQMQDQLIQNEPAEQSQTSADRVGKAKAASAQAFPFASQTAPRWTISASGLVQRSLDGGKTWLDVNVATDDSTPDRRVRAQMATIEVQADSTSDERSETQPEVKKQAKSRNNEKQSAPTVPVVFRALCVSTNATEVWAGGSGGALYHTMDAGNRWSRVIPSAAGIFLTGDILSIQFADPRNGTVTTSNAEVWTTLNDGQTWQKQP
jgi:hypothetical protein